MKPNLAIAVASVVLVGCSSGSEDSTPQPTIPAAVAGVLGEPAQPNAAPIQKIAIASDPEPSAVDDASEKNTPTPAGNGSEGEPAPAERPQSGMTPQSIQAKASGKDASPPTAAPANPYAGIMDARRRTFAERMDGLLEPVVGKGGAADQAVMDLKEAHERAMVVMQLGQYEIHPSPDGKLMIMDLARRIGEYRPSGTVTADNDKVERALDAADSILRAKVRRGAEVDRDIAKAIKQFVPGPGMQFQTSFGSLEGKLTYDELTAQDLAPYLFYLDACAKALASHRQKDAELHRLIDLFKSDRERFYILNYLTFAQWGETAGKVPIDMGPVEEKFKATERLVEVDHYLHTPYGQKPNFRPISGAWDPFLEEFKPYYMEAERERHRQMAHLFTDSDDEAIRSLARLQELRDELEQLFMAAIPGQRYRFRKVIELGPDGEPIEKPLPAIPFEVDPEDYIKGFSLTIKRVYDNLDARLSGRDTPRPFIILHHSIEDLIE